MMKLKCPELFGCPLPSECNNVFQLQAQNMLLSRDQLGRRVYIIRVGKTIYLLQLRKNFFPTLFFEIQQIISMPLP